MNGPLPVVSFEAPFEEAEFWAAGAEGRLVLPKCTVCEEIIWYPRPFCPDCHGTDVEWVAATGDGTVYTFTVVHRGVGAWAAHAPYVVAYVELAEGPRVLTNIVTSDPTRIRTGTAVKAVFHSDAGSHVLRFVEA